MPTKRTLQPDTYNDVLAQVGQLARDLDPHDYLTGTWLRELTVALALHDELIVSVVTVRQGGSMASFKRNLQLPRASPLVSALRVQGHSEIAESSPDVTIRSGSAGVSSAPVGSRRPA